MLKIINDPVLRSRYNARQQKRRRENPEKPRAYLSSWAKRNPEKVKAKRATNTLAHSAPGLHWHHFSYSKCHFREVMELSPIDHVLIHKNVFYDKDLLLYRKKSDNQVLYTMQSHADLLAHLKSLL